MGFLLSICALLIQSCSTPDGTRPTPLPQFTTTNFSEQVWSADITPEVKMCINAPFPMRKHAHTKLIFFALPNGNTIAQTIGKKLAPGDDWHFDIQHIGAQTRFLRNTLTNQNLVVIFLEAAQKSWPAWRKKHTNESQLISGIIDAERKRFEEYKPKVILSGHSGGGSFIFGFINSQKNIPDWVERIAFLDANYAYDAKLNHDQKFLTWLNDSTNHFLSVLAYNDAIALLNGKPFVSAAGGTWGRSHVMLDDFSKSLKIASSREGNLTTSKALDGRLEFLLMENPEQKILHTVQVERNGFIQAMLSGTELEGRGYGYFGDRAYTNFISN